LSSAKAKNTTIRSSCLDQNGSRFITGSEDGLICIWSSSDEEQNKNIEENQNKLKIFQDLDNFCQFQSFLPFESSKKTICHPKRRLKKKSQLSLDG